MSTTPAGNAKQFLQWMHNEADCGSVKVIPGTLLCYMNTQGNSNKFYAFWRFAHVFTSGSSTSLPLYRSRAGDCGVTTVSFFGPTSSLDSFGPFSWDWANRMSSMGYITRGIMAQLYQRGRLGAIMHTFVPDNERDPSGIRRRAAMTDGPMIEKREQRGYDFVPRNSRPPSLRALSEFNMFNRLDLDGATSHRQRIIIAANMSPRMAVTLPEVDASASVTQGPITRERPQQHAPAPTIEHQPRRRRRGIQL